jgi:predicted  nucleic acid-binding Zn-ribbon protein
MLKEQLKLLVELQEIDSSILSIVEKIESYPERLNQYRIPLNQAQEAFHKFKTKSESLDKKKKEKDHKLDEIEDKINKLKGRSGDIKTNKEYEAHLKEIESFEKKKYRIEDEILAIMEDYEVFAGEVEKEEVKVRITEAEFIKQEKLLGEEKKKHESELELIEAKRKDFAARLDEDIYNQYETLRKRFSGPAVVQTVNEICLGCNTNIPPQLFNDIRSTNEIYTCFYCKRFLYFKEPSPPGEKTEDISKPS